MAVDAVKVKIVETVIATDSAGKVVESMPIRAAVEGETDEIGRPVTPVHMVEDDAGYPVRIVTDKVVVNSVGKYVASTPSEGVGAVYDPLAIPQAFTAALTAGTSSLSLMIVGDSLGNEATEWVRQMDPVWAAFAPNYVVRNTRYDDALNAYVAEAMTGATAGTTLFADTFDRANGAVGTSSGGQSYGTVTAWAVSGNRLVQNTFANLLTPSANLGTDKLVASVDWRKSSSISDYVRLYGLYTSTSNAVYVSMQHNGNMILTYQPGVVQLAAIGTGGDMTTGEDVTLRLFVDGDWVKGEVDRAGTTYRIVARLSSVQKAALTGDKFGVATNAGAGSTIDNLLVSAISETRRLDIVNASVSGATIAYHEAELATTLLAKPDALIVSLGHNQGTDDATTYLADMDGLIGDILAAEPGTPIIVMSQNLETSAATNYLAHNARQEAIPAWAALRGHGLLDRYPEVIAGNVSVDGIHLEPAGTAQVVAGNSADFGID